MSEAKEVVSSGGVALEGYVARQVTMASLATGQSKGLWKLRITDQSGSSPLGVGKLKAVKLMLKLKSN